MSSSTTPSVSCVIDREVLNGDTYPKMKQLGLSVFAPLCGRNRGVFTTSPPDGNTYGCIKFPPDFAARAGVDVDANNTISDANAIELAYHNGAITSDDVVDLVDLYIQSVYASSGKAGVSGDAHACDVSGLTELRCESKPKTNIPKIRAATLAGVLSPAPWATNGAPLTLKQAQEFYTQDDFAAMARLGLNAVQIPVETYIFTSADGASELKLLGSLINMASKHDLGVVLLLESLSSSSSTTDKQLVEDTRAAASYCASNSDAILGLILPSPTLIAAARGSSIDLPLFIKAHEGDLPKMVATDDPNIFLALDRSHTTAVADVASADSQEDRLKMYYHENLACQGRALVEYSACFKRMPVYVFNGFNLAIDDCIHQEDADRFKDYGQCARLEERVDSGWWHRHRASFAARQLAGYETGLGWTFDAWKLYKENPDKVSLLDEPTKVYALKNVAEAGLFPSLQHSDWTKLKLACLNNPVEDFIMGDATYAPTVSPPPPPPDCGNGWWNYDTQQCDYWIPPTPCPTTEPLPVCEGGFWSQELGQCDSCPPPLTNKDMAYSGAIGVVAGLVVGYGAWKWMMGRGREAGYTAVPNASINV